MNNLSIIGIILAVIIVFSAVTYLYIDRESDDTYEQKLQDFKLKVREDLKKYDMIKRIRSEDGENRGILEPKVNFTKPDRLSHYQSFVTPNHPAVTNYIQSNGFTSISDAYDTAVQWTWVSDNTLHNKNEWWVKPKVFIEDTPNKTLFPKNPVDGMASDCESQSGFDGRILSLEIAKLLKKAKFTFPRIAWDNSFKEWKDIKKQINLLEKAGFNRKDIFVFVLYNWNYDYEVLENKRVKCYEFGVQLADCRFRPLNQTYDNYNPRKKKQTKHDYFIHPNWTDFEVRLFRKNVRRHNICVRYSKRFHSSILERKRIDKNEFHKIIKLPKKEILKMFDDAWFPEDFTEIYHNPEIMDYPILTN